MRTRRFMKGIRVIVGLIVAGVTMTGCQTVPQSGPVNTGLSNLNQADAHVLFSPGGPVVGAGAEDIVRGFVAAAASSADDYAVSRQFLSAEYAEAWDPYFGVLVDEGTQQFRAAGDAGDDDDAIGVLEVSAVAQIDQIGSYRPAAPGEMTELRFELVREDGEWRISSAPAGIILDKSTFAAAWTPQSLFFLSPDDRLVSDTRWFLNRTAIGTQIMGELLAGPARPMEGVVRTAFPVGTVLAAGSVPVVEGIARIELSAELLNADPATMELVKRQIGASFQAVPEVTRFDLLVNGSVIDGGTVISPESTVPTSQNQYVAVLRGDVFGPAGGVRGTQLPEIGERIAGLRPSAVSLASDRRSAAVLHEGRVSWVGVNDLVLIDGRAGQLQPGMDRFGFVWTYSTDEPGVVFAVRPGGDTVSMQLPGFDTELPAALRLSQGGSRVAVLVPDANVSGFSRVMVAGVVRNESGLPRFVNEQWATVLWVEGDPIDLDWIDDERFIVVTGGGGGSSRATQGVLGQFAVDSGTVVGASSVSGGGSRSLVRILDEKGRLYAPQGSGWQRQQGDIDLVAKVG